MKRNIYIIIYLVVAFIGCGLTLADSKHCFRYFTFLSNLYALIVMAAELISHMSRKHSVTVSRFVYSATMMLLLTGLTYNILLSDISSLDYWQNYLSLIMHLILPLMLLIYYFIFADKKVFYKYTFLYLFVPPYLYLAYILIRQVIAADGWYPYFFVDIPKIGVLMFIKYLVTMSAIFILFGLLFRRISKYS